MSRPSLQLLAILGLLVVANRCAGQLLAGFEGYSMGSNPGPAGTVMNARGLVTVLPHTASDFVANEYTWVLSGLVSKGSVLLDSIYTTTFDVGAARFQVVGDPSQDARPTFYNCPADIIGLDYRYGNPGHNDGALYMTGHFVFFKATYDIHTASFGEGTFVGGLLTDSRPPLIDWIFCDHGNAWTFGGVTTDQFACIPTDGDPVLGPYQQAMTGRIFTGGGLICLPNRASSSTWGRLRRTYQ